MPGTAPLLSDCDRAQKVTFRSRSCAISDTPPRPLTGRRARRLRGYADGVPFRPVRRAATETASPSVPSATALFRAP